MTSCIPAFFRKQDNINAARWKIKGDFSIFERIFPLRRNTAGIQVQGPGNILGALMQLPENCVNSIPVSSPAEHITPK